MKNTIDKFTYEYRATEWEIKKAVLGELVVTFEDGLCKVKVKTGPLQTIQKKTNPTKVSIYSQYSLFLGLLSCS